MWAVGTEKMALGLKEMESNEKPSACVRPTLTRLPDHVCLLQKTLVRYATCDPLAHSRIVVIPAGMTFFSLRGNVYYLHVTNPIRLLPSSQGKQLVSSCHQNYTVATSTEVCTKSPGRQDLFTKISDNAPPGELPVRLKLLRIVDYFKVLSGLPSEVRARAATSAVQDFWCRPPDLRTEYGGLNCPAPALAYTLTLLSEGCPVVGTPRTTL